MVSQEYVYAYAAVSIPDGGLDTLILPRVNSDCMQIFLDEAAARHSDERVVMILDGAGWHKASALNVPKNI
jgi:transposase-like protein